MKATLVLGLGDVRRGDDGFGPHVLRELQRRYALDPQVIVDCPNGDLDAHRIEANLYKLVNVIDVQDVTHQPNVTRDRALIKVQVGPERRAEVNGLAEIFRAHIVDVAAMRSSWKSQGRRTKSKG